MKIVDFSLEQGNKYFATIEGVRFFVGNRVAFDGGKGLMNVIGNAAQKYDRLQFRSRYGVWADFLHPTAMAEGGLYHTLNTYDRARFTFSFLQFAAHVPNGDFVVYFRRILALPQASEYFPDLAIEHDRVVRRTETASVQLESDSSTQGLMDYFNPSREEVEDTEVIQSAKCIHWVQNDPEHRRLQVDVGIANFRNKMAEYAVRYGLDGHADSICLVIADIRHQGRARSPEIVAALRSGDALEELLRIGEPQYHERLAVLRSEIGRLTAEGVLGKRNYSIAKKDFVDA